MVKRSLTSLEPLQRTNYFYGSSPIYAWITIVLTWLASLLPWREWEGAPDILILVLAFWCVQQVRGVGLTSALIFGLLMDVHDVNVMGEHALSYVLVIFGAGVSAQDGAVRFYQPDVADASRLFSGPLSRSFAECVAAGRLGRLDLAAVGIDYRCDVVVADLILKLPLRPVDDNETLN